MEFKGTCPELGELILFIIVHKNLKVEFENVRNIACDVNSILIFECCIGMSASVKHINTEVDIFNM